MKKKVLLLSALLPVLCSAQSAVSFAYDAAGNRVRREIVVNRQSAPRHDASQDYYADRLSDEYRVKIYPCADNGSIRVELISSGGSFNGFVIAYDLSGVKVQESSFENSNAYINLAGRPKGVYVLHIEVNGKSTDWKIIRK